MSADKEENEGMVVGVRIRKVRERSEEWCGCGTFCWRGYLRLTQFLARGRQGRPPPALAASPAGLTNTHSSLLSRRSTRGLAIILKTPTMRSIIISLAIRSLGQHGSIAISGTATVICNQAFASLQVQSVGGPAGQANIA